MKQRLLMVSALALLLSACAGVKTSAPPPPAADSDRNAATGDVTAPEADTPFDQIQDGAPLASLDPQTIADAKPEYSLIRVDGNISPYKVAGKEYTLVEDYRGFRQRGQASWYGTKFHGRKTSNGEIYSLYAMTAAHKTLPIPLYVRVTNLENGREAVVRVNDRGPFHSERIIDLSYAAAVKLGFAEQGTAAVEIEVIDTDNMRAAGEDADSARYYLQVGAFRQLASAEGLREQLRANLALPVAVASSGEAGQALHRVRVGPFEDYPAAQAARKLLKQRWSGEPSLVVEEGDS